MLNKKLKQFLIGSMSLSIALTLTQAVNAENGSQTISFQDKNPNSNELLNAFLANNKQSVAPAQPKVKFRGISFKKKAPAPQEKPVTQGNNETSSAKTCQAGSQSVAVSINFQSNSSSIRESDSQLIKNIAQAMNSPQLANCFFVVEGHTDAKGNDYYNLWLSQERAREVKNQLAALQVTGRRLVEVGKGESQLFNDNKPLAAENRRVEFRVINSTN